MSLDPLLLFLFVCLLIWCVFRLIKSQNELVLNIPGPRQLPLVGNVFSIIGRGGNPGENFLDYISSLGQTYGRRARFAIGRTPHVVLSDAIDIQKILGSDVHVNKPPLFKFFEEWVGVSIVSAPAKDWWAMRRLLNPLFKNTVLEKFVPEMDFQAKVCAKKLDEEAKKSMGDSIDVSPFMTNLTMDVLAKTAMGADIHSQDGVKSEFATAMDGGLFGTYRVTKLCIKRWLSPWLHPKFIWELTLIGKKIIFHKNAIHRITDKVIRERRNLRSELKRTRQLKETENGLDVTPTFLDTLLDLQDQGNIISDTQIRPETNLFLAAGHETIATSLQWVLARLGYHKDVQRKAHTELEMIFEGDLKRPVTPSDLRRMEYLEMVIKETLRLHPVAPVIMRVVEYPLHLGGGAVIKPGVTLLLHLAAVHKDPESYSSPEEFIPERFTREESSKRHPFAYLLFSLGPRMCIGHKFAMLEMKTSIANILRQFHINAEVSPNDIPTEFMMALRPRQGVRVRFTPRL